MTKAASEKFSYSGSQKKLTRRVQSSSTLFVFVDIISKHPFRNTISRQIVSMYLFYTFVLVFCIINIYKPEYYWYTL